MRFDPIDNRAISCQIEAFQLNGIESKLMPINSSLICDNESDVFLTKDPSYYLDGTIAPGDTVSIIFTIDNLNYDKIRTLLHDQREQLVELEAQKSKVIAAINAFKSNVYTFFKRE